MANAPQSSGKTHLNSSKERKSSTINKDKFLTFLLDKVEYGMQITKVREIIGRNSIMPMPETTEYILGIINLRGQIIPIIDLRLRFHVPAKDFDATTCIIIIERSQATSEGTKNILIGLLVDSVVGVVNINTESVDRLTVGLRDIHHDYLDGIAKTDKGEIVLLNIDQAIPEETLMLTQNPALVAGR